MLVTAATVPELTAAELAAGPCARLLVDVREPAEYAHGHLPGAVNLPQADLATRLDELPRDRPLLLVCQAGYRSVRSAQFLLQAGFSNVASLQGGTEACRAAGLPLEMDETQPELPRVIESEWAHA